jgi:hypothetical protein
MLPTKTGRLSVMKQRSMEIEGREEGANSKSPDESRPAPSSFLAAECFQFFARNIRVSELLRRLSKRSRTRVGKEIAARASSDFRGSVRPQPAPSFERHALALAAEEKLELANR